MNSEPVRQVLEGVVAIAQGLALQRIVHNDVVPISVHGNPDDHGRQDGAHQQLQGALAVHGGGGSKSVENPMQSGRTASAATVSPAYTTLCQIATKSAK